MVVRYFERKILALWCADVRERDFRSFEACRVRAAPVDRAGLRQIRLSPVHKTLCGTSSSLEAGQPYEHDCGRANVRESDHD